MATPKDCLAAAMSQYGGTGNLSDQFHNESSKSGASSPNFWQLGCVFDTMLDYAWLQKYAQKAKIEGARMLIPGELTKMMADARRGYEYGIGGNSAVWYDDFSWYGIAASKAFDPEYMEFFPGDYLEFFQNVALDMWRLVDQGDYQSVAGRIPSEAWYTEKEWKDAGGTYPDNNGWSPYGHWLSSAGLQERATYHRGTTHTWDACASQQSFFMTPGQNWAEPRFKGGAWQYDMYESQLPLQCWDGNSTAHPNPAELKAPYQGPFQFTLMTGLYVVLAQRLAQAARIKDRLNLPADVSTRLGFPETYDTAAAASFGFIDNWSAVDQGDFSWVLKDLDRQKNPMMLFRERAPTYAAPGEIPPGPGVYVDGYPVVPGFKSANFWCGDQGLYLGALVAQGRVDDARSLVRGISAWLTCPCKTNVVIGFTPPTFPDHGDYASGAGIFWRYVLYACRTNPQMHQYFVSLVGSQNDIVTASAENPENEATGLFKPFNQVAVEIAACYLLNEAKARKPRGCFWRP